MLLIFVDASGPWQRSLIVAQPLRVSDKKRCGAFACSFAWGGDAPMAFRHAGGGRAKRLGPQVLGPRRNDAEAAVQPQRRSWGPDGRSPGLRSSAHVSFRLASEAFKGTEGRQPRHLATRRCRGRDGLRQLGLGLVGGAALLCDASAPRAGLHDEGLRTFVHTCQCADMCAHAYLAPFAHPHVLLLGCQHSSRLGRGTG